MKAAIARRSMNRFSILTSGFCDLWIILPLSRVLLKAGVKKTWLAILSSIIITPLNILQWFLFGCKVHMAKVEKPPIFIIGPWRSGTTFFHDLMARDDQFGTIGTLQLIAPSGFLILRLFNSISAKLYGKRARGIDDFAYSLLSPQEEENVLLKTSSSAFYRFYLDPANINGYLQRLTEPKAKESRLFKRDYLKLLRLTSFSNRGKRLLLKNPPNTARIQELLSLYPEAQFITLIRKPEDVIRSYIDLNAYVFKRIHGDRIDDHFIRDQSISIYEAVMRSYLETVVLIPPQNLIEIRYEDLLTDREKTIGMVYEHFALDASFLKSDQPSSNSKDNGSHHGSTNKLDSKLLALVRDRFKDIYKRYGYAFS
jgi:hypothetical protein